MKRIFTILASTFAIAFAASSAHAAGTVKAQINGSAVAVTYANARYIDITPGSMIITTQAGTQLPVSISGPDVQAMVNAADFQANFIKIDTYRYISPTLSTAAYCQAGKSVIAWALGAPEYIADNCFITNAIYGASK